MRRRLLVALPKVDLLCYTQMPQISEDICYVLLYLLVILTLRPVMVVLCERAFECTLIHAAPHSTSYKAAGWL